MGEWKYHGSGAPGNPTINALYCTLLHALGDSRKAFNLADSSGNAEKQYGPLKELLS